MESLLNSTPIASSTIHHNHHQLQHYQQQAPHSHHPQPPGDATPQSSPDLLDNANSRFDYTKTLHNLPGQLSHSSQRNSDTKVCGKVTIH